MTRATPRGGQIEIICGCMFAGKTSELIRRLSAARDVGLRAIAIKHRLDDRYAAQDLATHDGRKFPGLAVPTPADVERVAADFDVIGIDEGHFFGAALAAAAVRLKEQGKRIVIVGLDHNAWGRDYPPFPQLKPHADRVDVFEAPCANCGAPAHYSQRVTPIVSGNMVGGVEDYEPRCHACFEPLPGEPPDD